MPSRDVQALEYFCRHPCHFANSIKVVYEDLHCRITVIVARPSADVSATPRCARDCRTILWLSICLIFKTRIRSIRSWTPEYLGYLCMALVGLMALEWGRGQKSFLLWGQDVRGESHDSTILVVTQKYCCN